MYEYDEECLQAFLEQQGKLFDEPVACLLYTSFLKHDTPKSLDSMKVSLKSPWTVKVTVKEKTIIGYLDEGSEYCLLYTSLVERGEGYGSKNICKKTSSESAGIWFSRNVCIWQCCSEASLRTAAQNCRAGETSACKSSGEAESQESHGDQQSLSLIHI